MFDRTKGWDEVRQRQGRLAGIARSDLPYSCCARISRRSSLIAWRNKGSRGSSGA